MTTEYRQLINENAVTAAALVNHLIGPPYTTTTAGAPATTWAPARVHATADKRTNTVIVTGVPEQVKQAIDMLNKMEADAAADTSTGTTVFFIARLKSGNAEEIVPVLNAQYGAKMDANGKPQALSGQAFFVANKDTNSILVTTDRLYEKKVREDLAKFDIAAPATVPAQWVKEVSPPGRLQLKKANAADVAKAINSAFATRDGPATIEAKAEAGSNTVVVTGDPGPVKAALEMAAKLDAEAGGKSSVEYVQLKSADAGDAARLINAMFTPAASQPKTSAARLYADSDKRTNTVIVTGPEEQVKQAMNMLKEIELIGAKAATQPGTRPATVPATKPAESRPAGLP